MTCVAGHKQSVPWQFDWHDFEKTGASSRLAVQVPAQQCRLIKNKTHINHSVSCLWEIGTGNA